MSWKLAEAKNKLSEVVRRALQEGPQRIERRHDAVVVLAAEEFERLTGKRQTLKEYLLAAPNLGELNLERDPSPMRDLEL
jgi:antitoxin Phd